MQLTAIETDALMGMRALQKLAYDTAVASGWGIDPVTKEPTPGDFPRAIALIHSELSEALEADRKGLMDDKLPHRPGAEVELADAMLRILHAAGKYKLDVVGAAIEKNRFNRTRADHKPENRLLPGGKKY